MGKEKGEREGGGRETERERKEREKGTGREGERDRGRENNEVCNTYITGTIRLAQLLRFASFR